MARRQLGGSEGAALRCNASCGVEADWPLAVADSQNSTAR
jgi:hypothetical protein